MVAYAFRLAEFLRLSFNYLKIDPSLTRLPPPRSNERWMSAGAAFLCQAAGRVRFEVEVLAGSGCMVVGFAGTNFRGEELGSDERGWGVDESGAAKHRRAGVGWSGRFCGCGGSATLV